MYTPHDESHPPPCLIVHHRTQASWSHPQERPARQQMSDGRGMGGRRSGVVRSAAVVKTRFGDGQDIVEHSSITQAIGTEAGALELGGS